jgi:pimeloyl-ACP methyl ester carboxylesterase
MDLHRTGAVRQAQFGRGREHEVASRRYPGDGLVDDVVRLPDGRELRYVTGGAAGPLVVLECGLGNTAGTWVAVQRALSAHCRTVSYDRAGLGGSDPAPGPRGLPHLAADLTALLETLDVREPVVLVGHSWGGPLVRLAAETRPDLVRAMVLVDPTFAAARKYLRGTRLLHARWHLAARLGLRTRLLRIYRDGLWRGLSPADLEVAVADMMTEPNLRTARRELAGLRASLAQVEQLDSRAPAVPYRYLIGTRGRGETGPVMTSEAARIAGLSPKGSYREVADAGHSIPQQSPQRTTDEVLDLIAWLP